MASTRLLDFGQTRAAIDIYLALAKNNRRNSTGPHHSIEPLGWPLTAVCTLRQSNSSVSSSRATQGATGNKRSGISPECLSFGRYPISDRNGRPHATALPEYFSTPTGHLLAGRWLTMLNRTKRLSNLCVERMLCSPFIITGTITTETLRAECLAKPSYGTCKQRPLLAANTDDESLAAEEFIPEADELPEMGRVPTLPPEPVPWGGSLSNGTQATQACASTHKLGHGEYASSLVKGLKPIPGYTDTEITYARSLLQQSLGAYNVAFQLVVRQFGQTLKRDLT